jgi:hypothetical protein
MFKIAREERRALPPGQAIVGNRGQPYSPTHSMTRIKKEQRQGTPPPPGGIVEEDSERNAAISNHPRA